MTNRTRPANPDGPDVLVQDLGTVWRFTPGNPYADEFLHDVGQSWQFWGDSLIVDHRVAAQFAATLLVDGWELQWA